MTSTALLTVGSTRFDSLVHAFLADDSLAALSQLGVTSVLAQVGASDLPSGWKQGPQIHDGDLKVEIIRFATDLEDRVGQANLVVSHAGAGSILSFVRPTTTSPASRSLILVPNSTLMDSHQADLADEFASKGWAHVCADPSALVDTLRFLKGPKAAPSASYPAYSASKVSSILDSTLGYT